MGNDVTTEKGMKNKIAQIPYDLLKKIKDYLKSSFHIMQIRLRNKRIPRVGKVREDLEIYYFKKYWIFLKNMEKVKKPT